MLNIWFNRTYATAYHALNLLRTNPDGVPVHLHATHKDPDSPVLLAADTTGVEPPLQGRPYVDWALDYCHTHKIDILFPVQQAVALSEAADEFAAVGTTLAVSPHPSMILLNDKVLTYQSVPSSIPTPPWREASSADEFLAAIDSLREQTDDAPLCLKPAFDAGGSGFRMLTYTRPRLTDLLTDASPTVHVEDVADAFEQADEMPRMLVLPYLNGPEVSVDTLSSQDSQVLAALPRAKPERRRVFRDEQVYIDYARTLSEHYGLKYLTNAQWRFWQGKPVLLEVNTRPSGGLFHTALTGLNLPWAATQVALGQTPDLPVPDLNFSYLTFQQAVRIA